MNVEYVAVVIGIAVVLLGAAIMWDAWGPQSIGPMRERRRRAREVLDLKGELVGGLGIVILGIAIIGRDWRLETITVILGTICIVVGVLRNWKYFREVLLFRGSARRRSEQSIEKSDKMRIH